MNYDDITDLKKIERELTDLSWQLDATEHDPEDYCPASVGIGVFLDLS